MSLANRKPLFTTSFFCHDNTKANLKKLNYTGVINNFSSIHVDRGIEISSEPFSGDDNFQWQIFLQTNPDTGYISLELCLHKPSPMYLITGNFYASILDAKNRAGVTDSKDFTISEETKRIYSPIKFYTFVRKEYLLAVKNQLLPEDRLTVVCEITYMSESDVVNHSTGIEDLKTLFEDKEFADITFCINGKNHLAHKSILAARSPVFKAMLKADMIENKTNRIELNDIDEPVFIEMLRYMYTGRPRNLKTTAVGLLEAADKYDLKELKAICVKDLIYNLSKDNVDDVLSLAVKYNNDDLKNEAIQYSKILSTFKSKRNRKYFDISNREFQKETRRRYRHCVVLLYLIASGILYLIFKTGGLI